MSITIIESFFKYGLCLCINLSALFYWISIIKKENFLFYKLAKSISFTSQTLIVADLSTRWIIFKYFPVSNLYETLLFLTWILIFTQIFIEQKVKSKIWGSIISPLGALICDFAILGLPEGMQKVTSLVPSLKSIWLMMHVSMMMLSYGTLLVGSLLSILFLILSRKISLTQTNFIDSTKETSQNSFQYSDFNTPPLMYERYDSGVVLASSTSNINNQNEYQLTSEKNISKKISLLLNIDIWSYRIIGLGFPLLTIGIIAGAVWANEAWGSYWSWDPKETWALITWLVFASYLHARITKGWQGKKAAFLGSFGFFVIWICYLGVNFLGKGLHSYGWLN